VSRKSGTEEVGWYTLTTFTSMASCGDRLITCIRESLVCQSHVKSSEKFVVERGVRQGLVLLPSVFLLGMDPLFRQLEGSGLDNNFYMRVPSC